MNGKTLMPWKCKKGIFWSPIPLFQLTQTTPNVLVEILTKKKVSLWVIFLWQRASNSSFHLSVFSFQLNLFTVIYGRCVWTSSSWSANDDLLWVLFSYCHARPWPLRFQMKNCLLAYKETLLIHSKRQLWLVEWWEFVAGQEDYQHNETFQSWQFRFFLFN